MIVSLPACLYEWRLSVDTDQSVALMIAKVTILLTPIGGKSVTETFIDTDNDSYGDIKLLGVC